MCAVTTVLWQFIQRRQDTNSRRSIIVTTERHNVLNRPVRCCVYGHCVVLFMS